MLKLTTFLLPVALLATLFASAPTRAAEKVEIKDNQLYIDGKAQPQLFGAELQYFRLRGGPGRNVPREKVIALWNKALDRMVEAHMNAISFYIPWDFHEYAEGKFDFTGTADEDGDGKPDYPSRDLLTFFKLIEQHGIHRIMVRPGPYVNAEWGFLGFGAVPEWFHDKFPDSHMVNPQGLRTKLYDYHNPDFLKYSQRWFSELYKQVLNKFIGKDGPVIFVQVDNETNFMWQSIWNHDYGPRAVARYHDFLKTRYSSVSELNEKYGTQWKSWDDVQPPSVPGKNVAEDQDWYRFQDVSMRDYLRIIRKDWEELGVREPQIIFTLAESYNAAPNGILPNYRYRNEPKGPDSGTGMMTVNLYPKTEETPEHPLLNQPFKADHDVKAADQASDHYLGSRQEWVLGPEIQAGWWKGIPVTDESRRQTYLSTIGHGLKALFLYYFNEGDNWGSDWARRKIEPEFDQLRARESLQNTPTEKLPDSFWNELQAEVDRKLVVGFNAKWEMTRDIDDAWKLYFDAPLGHDAEPGSHYALVKEIGTKVVAPYEDFLARAVEVTDPVAVIQNIEDHVPSSLPGVDALKLNSDWAGGLLAYLLHAGVNPTIHQWKTNPNDELASDRVIVYQDAGSADAELAEVSHRFMQKGGTVISFIGDSLAKRLGLSFPSESGDSTRPVRLKASSGSFVVAPTPVFSYQLPAASEHYRARCEAILHAGTKVVGYSCGFGRGRFVQIGALPYDEFNSNSYAFMKDVPAKRAFLERLLEQAGVKPQVRIAGGGDRVVAFARRSPDRRMLWITVKSARLKAVKARVLVDPGLLADAPSVEVSDVLSGEKSRIPSARLASEGFSVKLGPNGSTAFALTPAQ